MAKKAERVEGELAAAIRAAIHVAAIAAGRARGSDLAPAVTTTLRALDALIDRGDLAKLRSLARRAEELAPRPSVTTLVARTADADWHDPAVLGDGVTYAEWRRRAQIETERWMGRLRANKVPLAQLAPLLYRLVVGAPHRSIAQGGVKEVKDALVANCSAKMRGTRSEQAQLAADANWTQVLAVTMRALRISSADIARLTQNERKKRSRKL